MPTTLPVALTAATLAVTALTASPLFAGPLNPPAGPVTPTMKTLSDVEPRAALSYETAPGDNTCAFKITNPGSYYLTRDVWIPPNLSGIVIAASPVTIDLNGFSIIGLQGSHDGITANGQAGRDVRIRNGGVAWFGQAGINLSTFTNVELRDITCSVTVSTGIAVGADSTLINCAADHCGTGGISVGDRCTLTGCTSSFSTYGFAGTTRDTFTDCTASENSMAGFSLGSQTTIRGCQSLHNSQQGIVVTDNCSVLNNQCRANGGTSYASIWAYGNGSTIQNNQTSDSGYGVYISGNNNTVSGNTITSPAQRIVLASGTSNLIIQNVAHNAPNGFQIAALNRVGPIVQTSINLLPINGLSYNTGINTTDPYANLVTNN